MAGVRLERTAKSYGRHRVFENLDLTIEDGECFTLLGPSGCGKTVILRLIAGFEHPSSGSIFIGDNLVSSAEKKVHLPPEARRISVVFQDYAVWPHKTVYDNVIYPLTIQGIPGQTAGERTDYAIKQVNLRGLEKRFPFQLSGGQQQRVALARALVSSPKIMLLDEPLCNLDANLREEMRFEIKELQRKTGVTILYVTHDQEIAMAISDRVAIMDRKGFIRQVGPPDDIYENPSGSFVFRFMGISNFIPLEARNGSLYVKDTGILFDFPGEVPLPGKDVVAACRPSDVELLRDSTNNARAVIKRAVFLGPLIDYRVELGDREIRVQQDTQEALTRGLLFPEGETCGLRFHSVKWFDAQCMEEEGNG